MSIQVVNDALRTIEVSINEWGDAKTGYYSISPNGRESWSRSDSRGFVMYVKGSNSGNGPWYVKAGSVIKFHENGTITTQGTARQI